MTPDPGMLYLTAQHREALAGLAYAVMNEKGFVVLAGEAGTGKTTLLARVLQHFPQDRVHASLIFNPTLTPSEFLEMALLGWGLKDLPESKPQRLLLLRQMLLKAREQHRIVVLVVDEAHTLSNEVLEEIRLLGNFEHAEHKLLQIILAGQSELTGLLNREDLRQFKQRVAVRLKIDPLSASEVEEYIRSRWEKAGGLEAPFSREASADIARWSRGIPRVINAICDNAITLAIADGAAFVRPAHVTECCRDLDLLPAVEPVPAVTAPVLVTTVEPAPAEALVRPAVNGSHANGDASSEVSVALKTLERYEPVKRPKSFLARFAGKLGFVN
jgi:general secretion pathway protein A